MCIRDRHSLTKEPESWLKAWGIDASYEQRGALKTPEVAPAEREIYLLQRKETKVGKHLGKTTGWIHRQTLKQKNVQMIPGVAYQCVDDKGLHITVDGQNKVLEVDNVIVCAGQEPNKALFNQLIELGVSARVIGGADVASELDAKRAIRQGAELAAVI